MGIEKRTGAVIQLQEN